MFSGSSPREARSIPSVIARPVAAQTSDVEADQCGVRIDIVQLEQGIIERERLDIEDVKAGTRDSPLA